ncbi:MAG TPA: holo-ACP synthase [Gammaproteobacteria bacterium]|nr:holo-ACP synthase [Gammaproteobacteria bacterium]
MIFGIGTDVLKLERVEHTWQRFGEHFARRLLLDEEHALFVKAKRPVRFLAMRFAAKEAIVKALGTGFANGIWIRDVGMLPNKLGQPQVIFSARGRALCRKLGVGEGHLTLSDEGGLVVAVAVLMRAGRARAKRAAANEKRAGTKRRARRAAKDKR